jgi:hypothetical protein
MSHAPGSALTHPGVFVRGVGSNLNLFAHTAHAQGQGSGSIRVQLRVAGRKRLTNAISGKNIRIEREISFGIA